MIKNPNVSGQFYTADPKELSQQIDSFIAHADGVPRDKRVAVLISPHAGYIYSGWVAAYGYKAISRNHYTTVVLIGPSHFVDYPGVSIWPKGSFKTPLGGVDVDEEFVAQLMKADPQMFRFAPEAYAKEHSLEVQLPFLQKVMPNVKIVPILMGRPDFKICQTLADALDKIVGKREDVLVLVSTDMSHYHEDSIARKMDNFTLSAIKAKNPEALWSQCLLKNMELCGFTSAITGLLYARKRNLNHVDILKYGNSGDVTHNLSSVVGYSSTIIYAEESQRDKSEPSFTKEQKKELLTLARNTMETFVKTGKVLQYTNRDARFNEYEGAFVTLEKKGSLRGCIGHIIGDQELFKTVRDMTIAAASEDPRFKPVGKEELADLDVEISVLSKPWPIKSVDDIEMGKHGVIVKQGSFNQGVFLPQVATDTGWSKEKFLAELCSQKAGLPSDCWKNPRTSIYIFTADVFSQKDME